MNNMDIWSKVSTTPPEAKKSIQAGRLRGFTDINPMWRIKKLTEVFGVCGFGWKARIINREIVEYDGVNSSMIVTITVALNVKIDGEWSDDIVGVGGSEYVSNEKSGKRFSDEAEKMAYTDALGICCKMLGFSSDVYFEKDRTKYSGQEALPKKEYKCCDCGKPFEGFTHDGKSYNAGQAYHIAESKNTDKKARCRDCRLKKESDG